MPDDVFEAARKYFHADDLGYIPASIVAHFYAGAAWGASIGKLTQAEIAAIAATIAVEKERP